MTRREGLKGVTGAQDPAPKGLDPPLSLRFTVHAWEGGNETASRVEKDDADVHPNTRYENKDASLHTGIRNWKSGNEGRARRHLSLTRSSAISAASYAASPTRDYTLVKIIKRPNPIVFPHFTIIIFSISFHIVQLYLHLSYSSRIIYFYRISVYFYKLKKKKKFRELLN